jgi:hypothetical protein
MKGIILAVTASAFLIGCGSGPDVELEWESKPVNMAGMFAELQYMHVTSLEDDKLEVTGMVVNRGNCRLLGSKLPRTIDYGEVATIQLNNDCKVREVELQTSHGSEVYEW